MPVIGPSLPPHLAGKRKRSTSESSEDGPAPAPPTAPRSQSSNPAASHGPGKAAGPALSPSTTPTEQPRRVVGPAPSPALLDAHPPDGESFPVAKKPNVDDESSDDDIGPAPPPANGVAPPHESWEQVRQPDVNEKSPKKTLQREDWMLAPPSGVDWAQRIDPTKLKSRKFNTMKGAKAPPHAAGKGSSGVGGLWTETPEEKRKRLQEEVMGTKSNAPAPQECQEGGRAGRVNPEVDHETERKVRDYNEAHRGSSSLLERHRSRKNAKEEEDDPSKRAFDREKDIAGGAVSSLQRREVLNRAKDMGSRFEKARYL